MCVVIRVNNRTIAFPVAIIGRGKCVSIQLINGNQKGFKSDRPITTCQKFLSQAWFKRRYIRVQYLHLYKFYMLYNLADVKN